MVANKDHLKLAGKWSSIWKLHIPPKVRFFLWRALCGCLPTRMRLRSHHVTVDGVCLYYARGLENNWHLFFGCSFAEACWRQARLWSFIDQSFLSSSSFQELVFTLLDVFDDYQRQRFVMILWSMWNARNGKCWENKHTWPSHIIQ